MTRPTIAVVTRFTKNSELLQLSMAPLRELKRRGAIQRLLCVTWDTPEVDAFVAPIAAMPDVELFRVAQPAAKGSRYQKGVIYQVRNLEAALAEIPEEDALVLKTRPDFVADAEFLQSKIQNFDTLCALSNFPAGAGLNLRPPPFRAKIWVPWADANQPFLYEDAFFLGLKCDIEKLVTPHIGDKLSGLDSARPFAHVVRYATPFRTDYPMFSRYMREYKYFTNDMDYRRVLIPTLTKEAYFWTLVVVHAWILANSFHVDAGSAGQLRFYANIFNEGSDWSSLASLRINPPFDNVDGWRRSVKRGSLVSGAARLYGRLMDNSWQHALFSQPGPTDIARDQLLMALKCTSRYGKGMLKDQEIRSTASYRACIDSTSRGMRPNTFCVDRDALGGRALAVEPHNFVRGYAGLAQAPGDLGLGGEG